MRNCPRCLNTAVIEDGYCGVCRECTMQPLPVKRGTDSQQRVVMPRRFAYTIETLKDNLAYHRKDHASDPELHDARIAEVESAIKLLQEA